MLVQKNASTNMRIEALGYYQAARERIDEAEILYQHQCFGLSIYVAGLAVECLFRAFRSLVDPHFEARHDLLELLSISGLEAIGTGKSRRDLAELTGIIFSRWKNDLRYASEKRLRRHFKRLKLDRGIRGDFLKENCRVTLQAAQTIVALGSQRWPTNPA